MNWGGVKMEWIPANYVNDNYIPDARLKNIHTIILVTYETLKEEDMLSRFYAATEG